MTQIPMTSAEIAAAGGLPGIHKMLFEAREKFLEKLQQGDAIKVAVEKHQNLKPRRTHVKGQPPTRVSARIAAMPELSYDEAGKVVEGEEEGMEVDKEVKKSAGGKEKGKGGGGGGGAHKRSGQGGSDTWARW
jgi:hypothetical protein